LKHNYQSYLSNHFLRLLWASAWVLSFTAPVFAQSMGPRGGKKTKVENTHLDPTLRKIEGQLSFDEKTKKALERSKKPGVLLAASMESDKIYRISIIGANKVEPDAVALRLVSKIGQNFSPVLIAEDIREIYKMGLFANVEIWQQKLASDAYEIEYRLTEIPTIFQIKISGNEALSEDEIKESLAGLENYQGAKTSRLQANREKIRELYVAKGYYLANVNYEIHPSSPEDIKKREKDGLGESSSSKGPAIEIDTTNVAAPDFVDVTFKIEENAKVKVNRIYFSGNKRLSDEKIRPNLRSHEEHALSILNDMGTFRKDYLEIDGLILEKLLHDHGMLKAKILPPLVELGPDKSTIDIGYRMIEGDQYSLGDLSIAGDKVEHSEVIYRLQKEARPEEPIFYSDKLLKEISQKKGEVFNKSLMAENVMAISEKYRDEGYAYANVSPMPTFNEEEKSVDININVESGPRVRVERIDIVGNEKTKDEVIRRELDINEGDYYSSTGLRLSENNVSRLGYFETVEMTNQPGSAPDRMVVTIKVKEQSTGNIQAGAGYGTGGEGIVLRGQISNQNLFGRGQTLSAQVNWSNYRQEFDVMFIEPSLTYVFSNPLTFAFTAYNRKRNMGEFTRSAIGGDFTFGYPVGGPLSHISRKWKNKASPNLVNYVLDFDALLFYLTYTVERVEISDLSTDARKWDLYQGVPRYTTSLRPTLKLDQRDNRMFPTRGIYAEVRADFASEYFGSIGLAKLENKIRGRRNNDSLADGRNYLKPLSQANNFIKYGANFRAYHNLDEWFFINGFVFKTNFELGILDTLGNPLIFENFALGGPNSVRGYSYRSISPIERAGALFPFDSRRDLPIGGNKQFYGSFELEFPLIKALKIGGVLFFDFGNAFSNEDNFFYLGGKSENAKRIHPNDPLRLYEWLGLYSSVGFGLRWNSPLGYLRFEWGIPLNRRPSTTPGLTEQDRPIGFEFNIGPSF
jgi:outer membrane protein insertion porin family